jgi:hypothetical protein
MRYRVILSGVADSPSYQDKSLLASFAHVQHAIAFAERLTAGSYVVDCFDDTTIYKKA